jgi:hypothetical protein
MRIILLLAFISAIPTIASAETNDARCQIEEASKMCDGLLETNIATECNVGALTNVVDAVIPGLGVSDAGRACHGFVQTVNKHTNCLAGKWKFRIISPFSNGTPIHVCNF